MISVSCSCGRKFKADDHHAGKRTKCPVCGSMLVIGQPPAAVPSGVNDNGEVPSWWFPSGSSPKLPRQQQPPRQQPPPTRSGSDPDDIQTTVMPAQPASHPEPSSEGKTGSPAQPPPRGPGTAKLVLGVLGGALVVGVLDLGAIVWQQTAGNRGPATPPVPSSLLVNQASKEATTVGLAQPQPTDEAKSCKRSPVGAR
jgi:DNA-directed RNA polymerase subunit RPC12/RpoP